MRIAVASSLVVASLVLFSPAFAGDTPAPVGPKLPPLPTVAPEIAWIPTVAEAVAAAKAQSKPLFVAINADRKSTRLNSSHG